jgi:hypothetical protein
MTIETSAGRAALDTLVAGVGIGLMMQVFTMSVQNSVGRADIGAATALTQTWRAFGATVGVAAMGVIVNQRLPAGVGDDLASGAGVEHLSRPLRISLEHALQPVFLLAACTAAVLFVVVLAGVRDVDLRRAVDEAPGPAGATRAAELPGSGGSAASRP